MKRKESFEFLNVSSRDTLGNKGIVLGQTKRKKKGDSRQERPGYLFGPKNERQKLKNETREKKHSREEARLT